MSNSLKPMFGIGSRVQSDGQGILQVTRYLHQRTLWFVEFTDVVTGVVKLVPCVRLEDFVGLGPSLYPETPWKEIDAEETNEADNLGYREAKKKAYKERRAQEIRQARKAKRSQV